MTIDARLEAPGAEVSTVAERALSRSRLANAPESHSGPLRAEAIASWADRRNARALVKLTTAEGRGLSLLDVEYTVLTPKMFARFNPPIDHAKLASTLSCGQLSFDVSELAGGVRVDSGPIPATVCAGHFPDYPAAPVAIVMGQLCKAAVSRC